MDKKQKTSSLDELASLNHQVKGKIADWTWSRNFYEAAIVIGSFFVLPILTIFLSRSLKYGSFNIVEHSIIIFFFALLLVFCIFKFLKYRYLVRQGLQIKEDIYCHLGDNEEGNLYENYRQFQSRFSHLLSNESDLFKIPPQQKEVTLLFEQEISSYQEYPEQFVATVAIHKKVNGFKVIINRLRPPVVCLKNPKHSGRYSGY